MLYTRAYYIAKHRGGTSGLLSGSRAAAAGRAWFTRGTIGVGRRPDAMSYGPRSTLDTPFTDHSGEPVPAWPLHLLGCIVSTSLMPVNCCPLNVLITGDLLTAPLLVYLSVLMRLPNGHPLFKAGPFRDGNRLTGRLWQIGRKEWTH